MTIEDDIAFLQRIPILRRLGASALRILAIGAESSELEPGQVLFKAGDTADCAYVVQERLVRAQARNSRRSRDDRRSRHACSASWRCWRRRAGRRPRRRSKPSMVLRISRAMFRKMLEGYPEAAQRLRDVIAARADQWARDMENVRDALAPDSEQLTLRE